MPTIQKILRHKNLTTTQGYIHELDNARDLMAALSRTNKSPRTRSSRPRAGLVAVVSWKRLLLEVYFSRLMLTDLLLQVLGMLGVPKGIWTPVTGVKGRCPGPG